eukprot:scaffold37859_cov50-Phaeocystis_antarctica.AAC.2
MGAEEAMARGTRGEGLEVTPLLRGASLPTHYSLLLTTHCSLLSTTHRSGQHTIAVVAAGAVGGDN